MWSFVHFLTITLVPKDPTEVRLFANDLKVEVNVSIKLSLINKQRSLDVGQPHFKFRKRPDV